MLSVISIKDLYLTDVFWHLYSTNTVLIKQQYAHKERQVTAESDDSLPRLFRGLNNELDLCMKQLAKEADFLIKL